MWNAVIRSFQQLQGLFRVKLHFSSKDSSISMLFMAEIEMSYRWTLGSQGCCDQNEKPATYL